MLWNVLSAAASNSGADAPKSDPTMTYIFMGIIVVAFIVMMVVSRRNQKKREEETNKMLDAIKPGNKVKTIGGICGVVVEICPEDNSFVLETGTEQSGKSYIKFDKQAVYQTDAVAEPEKKEEKTEDK